MFMGNRLSAGLEGSDGEFNSERQLNVRSGGVPIRLVLHERQVELHVQGSLLQTFDIDPNRRHGSGNPEPDVRRDLLDKRAVQVIRDSTFDAYVDPVAPNAYDAVAVVGMHAKTGSGGIGSCCERSRFPSRSACPSPTRAS